MKKLLPLTFAVLIASTSLVNAYSRNFKFTNDTTVRVDQIYFSTPVDTKWKPIRMDGTIGPNESANVSFDNSGPCNLQVRIHYTEAGRSKSVEWQDGLNFCSNSTLTLEMNSDGSLFIRYR